MVGLIVDGADGDWRFLLALTSNPSLILALRKRSSNHVHAWSESIAARGLLGEKITLKPAKGGGHLVAHLAFHRAALLGTPPWTDAGPTDVEITNHYA
jgi:hypothetical protein